MNAEQFAEQFAPYIVHDDKNIKGFFGEYRFLSNFHECTVAYKGVIYPNSEAAYQAAKTLELAERKLFTTMTASEAKSAGRRVTIREGWEQVKDVVMFEILTNKFIDNSELSTALRNTGNKYLEETNWWGDTYWGTSYPPAIFPPPKTTGQNQLGKILMMVRTML